MTSTGHTWSFCPAEHLSYGSETISNTRELQALSECGAVVRTQAQAGRGGLATPWSQTPVCDVIESPSGLCRVSRLGCGFSLALPEGSSLRGSVPSVLLTVYYLFSLNL